MGLDLLVEGRAKPGHEVEWREILARSFKDRPDKGDDERFCEISIPPFTQVGAPRVGYDPAADAWIIEAQRAGTPEEIATALKKFHGHYALPLAISDGLPKYSHGGVYKGVDETSFRGKFLELCDDVLANTLIEQAFEHRFPTQAIDFGRALLAAADTAEAEGALPVPPPPPPKRGFFARFDASAWRRGWVSVPWMSRSISSELPGGGSFFGASGKTP